MKKTIARIIVTLTFAVATAACISAPQILILIGTSFLFLCFIVAMLGTFGIVGWAFKTAFK